MEQAKRERVREGMGGSGSNIEMLLYILMRERVLHWPQQDFISAGIILSFFEVIGSNRTLEQ